MTDELNRCMANYTAARRMRENIDLQGAMKLVHMVKREVPRMILALRSASTNPIWTILAKHFNDMIRIAKDSEKLSVFQWQGMLAVEHPWRKAFMKARDDIENRIGTDLQDLQRTENLYQTALEDATDSEEGESIEDFGEGDEPDEDAGENEDADPEDIPLPEGLLRLTNLANL